MGKKTIILIMAVLVAILALVAVYYVSESPDDISGNMTELTVYSEGPIPLSDIVKDIETAEYYNGHDNDTTAEYYNGHDNDTLNWMKSLGNKSVFSGNGTFVIMSQEDARKIPSVYATDVIITETFECKVLETHSLGNVKYPKDVLLVENVNYLNETIDDIPGGGA